MPLSEARQLAGEHRYAIWHGQDPVAERKTKIEEQQVASQAPTFGWCADKYIAAHEAGWKNPKHRYQWRATIEQFANPVIGDLPVDEVTANHVVDILEPHWLTKTESIEQYLGGKARAAPTTARRCVSLLKRATD